MEWGLTAGEAKAKTGGLPSIDYGNVDDEKGLGGVFMPRE